MGVSPMRTAAASSTLVESVSRCAIAHGRDAHATLRYGAVGSGLTCASFGSFFVRQKGQRMGRNPKTGEEVPIHPRKVLVFRASHVLKNRINQVPSDDGGS